MRRYRRLLIILLILLVILPALLAGWVLIPFAARVQHFPADNDAGFFADFYLYVSPQAKRRASHGEKIVLLVQPNNSGTNSDDPAFHQRDAWWTCFGRHKLANELEVALLVPAFIRPGENWQVYTHALDRDVFTTTEVDIRRTDLQLLVMVDVVDKHFSKQGIKLDSKVLIQGFSASGMFANRFAFRHPDRVMAVAAGSPGGWPIVPIEQFQNEQLDYPAGIADFEELTGTRFDLSALRQVPQLIVMGDQDTNDSVDFGDGWDKPAADQLERLFGTEPIDRWDVANQVYDQQRMDAEFLLVPGIGHDRKSLQKYSTDFFRKQLDR